MKYGLLLIVIFSVLFTEKSSFAQSRHPSVGSLLKLGVDQNATFLAEMATDREKTVAFFKDWLNAMAESYADTLEARKGQEQQNLRVTISSGTGGKSLFALRDRDTRSLIESHGVAAVAPLIFFGIVDDTTYSVLKNELVAYFGRMRSLPGLLDTIEKEKYFSKVRNQINRDIETLAPSHTMAALDKYRKDQLEEAEERYEEQEKVDSEYTTKSLAFRMAAPTFFVTMKSPFDNAKYMERMFDILIELKNQDAILEPVENLFVSELSFHLGGVEKEASPKSSSFYAYFKDPSVRAKFDEYQKVSKLAAGLRESFSKIKISGCRAGLDQM